jgi:tetratricopeptide (TPR) repeat protein
MARGDAIAGEVEVLDEEFLHHLQRGADELARGDAGAAVAPLQRARELRPRDPKVLGLLGQALYRLGRFEDAIEAYQQLVDESPVEAAARVNLGLANLKAKRFPQAIRQLDIALDLQPDHRRAAGYLGLAWLEQGDPRRARQWFERAGSSAMVARCDELLAAAEQVVHDADRLVEDSPAAAAGAWAGQGQSQGQQGQGNAASTDGAEVGAVRQVLLTREGPFAVDRGLVLVRVAGDVVARAEGLVAVRGAVRLTREVKRFRGQPTQEPFGEGPRRMLRASGDGVAVYSAAGVRLARVDLAGDTAYFREDAVFAFEASIAYENGRVSSRMGTDLELVHVRGGGQLLLATAGEVVAIAVASDAPLRVPAASLVGWIGSLTPQFGPLVEAGPAPQRDGGGEPLAVELSGSGRVLVEGAAG